MAIQIVWFRNDLRLHDHQPLRDACGAASGARSRSGGVLPLYVLDPRSFHTTSFGFDRIGPSRRRFLLESLHDLDGQLRSLGSRLHVFVGQAEEVLGRICGTVAVDGVHFHREFAPEERGIEDRVTAVLKQQGISACVSDASTMYRLRDLPFSLAMIPEVFTDFRRQVERRCHVPPSAPPPDTIPPIAEQVSERIDAVQVESIDEHEWNSPPSHSSLGMHFQGGETAALRRLDEYVWQKDRLKSYKQTRNGMLHADDSSKLSPWLAMGCISARRIYGEVCRYEEERVKNDSTYWLKFELLWRDYFAFMVAKHGATVFQRGGLRRLPLPWQQDRDMFDKWCLGLTGYPLIDANMRELKATGFMSNRGRQNVASFLTKNLGIDWRMGAEWFESWLIDYDPCSNYGNWNYAAGVGNDARGFRWFNPLKQSQQYDPDGSYVKYWLPELRRVPVDHVHAPWRMSAEVQAASGCRLGVDYPHPIVDLFASARQNEQRYDEACHGPRPKQQMLW